MSTTLKDDAGNESSMRTMCMMIVVAILAVYLFSNLAMIVNALRSGGAIDIVDFKPYMIGAMVSALGGKATQKFAEAMKK